MNYLEEYGEWKFKTGAVKGMNVTVAAATIRWSSPVHTLLSLSVISFIFLNKAESYIH